MFRIDQATAGTRHYSPTTLKTVAKIEARDRKMLLGFVVASTVLIALGEWAAFHYGMVNRYGIVPVLLRAIIYIAAASTLWALLLSANRRHVGRLMQRNELYFHSLLEAYEGALELKDYYTGGHGRRVAEYTAVLCKILELSDEEFEQITHAALLHDIGKIGVPDSILTKPAALTDEEFAYIRQHPVSGANLLDRIDGLQELSPLVRYHHERYSGGGYPSGLQGKDIPFGARIIALADSFDALTTVRPYKSAVSFEQAFEELLRGRQTLYDPGLVDAFSSSSSFDALRAVFDKVKDGLQ
ncbi:MAG: HD-GYP domain-containing protein [Spirochaetia bacterium]|nr:HD-GYP domain-containing protein [Spirochaetia bacterium]